MKDCLIIGVEFSHGSITKCDDGYRPSCVGIAANTTDEQIDNGRIFYIKGKSTIIDSDLYGYNIQEVLKNYVSHHPGLPKKIVIYRSGASIGQFEAISSIEVKRCHDAIAKYFIGIKSSIPPFYYLLVRRPKERFIPANVNANDNGARQNVKPGTVISTGFSTPALKEFSLVAHAAQLGTAKPVTLTVLYPTRKIDENTQKIIDISESEYDQLIQLTNNLCYTCDAVNSPISVPGPTDSATKIAQRGMNNWKKHIENNPVAFPGQVDDENKKDDIMDQMCENWSEILQPKLNTAYWT